MAGSAGFPAAGVWEEQQESGLRNVDPGSAGWHWAHHGASLCSWKVGVGGGTASAAEGAVRILNSKDIIITTEKVHQPREIPFDFASCVRDC